MIARQARSLLHTRRVQSFETISVYPSITSKSSTGSCSSRLFSSLYDSAFLYFSRLHRYLIERAQNEGESGLSFSQTKNDLCALWPRYGIMIRPISVNSNSFSHESRTVDVSLEKSPELNASSSRRGGVSGGAIDF